MDWLPYALLGFLRSIIKNPAKKAELCHILINIRDTITYMYPTGCDPVPPTPPPPPPTT